MASHAATALHITNHMAAAVLPLLLLVAAGVRGVGLATDQHGCRELCQAALHRNDTGTKVTTVASALLYSCCSGRLGIGLVRTGRGLKLRIMSGKLFSHMQEGLHMSGWRLYLLQGLPTKRLTSFLR